MHDSGLVHLPNMPCSGQAEMLLPSLGHPAVVGVQDRIQPHWEDGQETRNKTQRRWVPTVRLCPWTVVLQHFTELQPSSDGCEVSSPQTWLDRMLLAVLSPFK